MLDIIMCTMYAYFGRIKLLDCLLIFSFLFSHFPIYVYNFTPENTAVRLECVVLVLMGAIQQQQYKWSIVLYCSECVSQLIFATVDLCGAS